jgi:hypothetical protein
MTNPNQPVDELVHQALEKVEAELAELEPQFELLRIRLMNLRQASASLRQLLSLDLHDQGHGPGFRPSEARNRELEALQRATTRAREAAIAAQAAAMAAQVEAAEYAAVYGAGADTTSEPTSTSRVIELLREANGESLTRKQIHEAFKLRGWIDPRWREPEAAIRMAIRRAGEQPEVVRTGTNGWAYRGSVSASTEEGGD